MIDLHKLLHAYKEEMKEVDIVKILEDIQISEQESSNGYKGFRLAQEFLVKAVGTNFLPPGKVKGEVFSIFYNNNIIDFFLTGQFVYPYYVVLKVSDYFQLGGKHHIETTIEEEEKIVVQRNNVFFLTNQEIDDSLYRGFINEDINTLLYDGNNEREIEDQDGIKEEFDKLERSLVADLRQRSCYDLYSSVDVEIADFPDHVLEALPMAASEANDLDEDYGENFTILRDSQSHKLKVIIDEDIVGRFGLLIVNNCLFFSGFLPPAISLGIDDSINLASLKAGITVSVEDKRECRN